MLGAVNRLPKATITMPSGTVVSIEGTPEEVEAILRRLEAKSSGPEKELDKTHSRKSPAILNTVKDYIIELRETGFFKEPKSLKQIGEALRTEGHIIPNTTLSGEVLDLTKSRDLRRLKDGNVWKYVNR